MGAAAAVLLVIVVQIVVLPVVLEAVVEALMVVEQPQQVAQEIHQLQPLPKEIMAVMALLLTPQMAVVAVVAQALWAVLHLLQWRAQGVLV